jgi:hypothetical protein
MSRVRVVPIVAVAVAVLLVSCSKDEAAPGGGADAAPAKLDSAAPGADTGGAPDGPGNGPGDASAGVDSKPAAPTTCGGIRNCVLACGADAACAKQCVDAAPAGERSKHAAVLTCTKQECPDDDEVCRCMVQCFAPSNCIELVDECVALDEDRYCTEDCR